MRAGVVATCVLLVAAAGRAELPPDLAKADVCALVPGAEVAAAVGGRLVEARLTRPEGDHARCVYVVGLPGAKGERPAAFVLWLSEPGNYAGLRRADDRPADPVDGLGDEAVVAFDPDTRRHDLFVLVRGVATIEVTGADAEATRAVAEAAVRTLRAETSSPR